MLTPKTRHRASITDPKLIGPLLRAVDALQIEQVAAIIDHRDDHVPVVLLRLGFGGGGDFFRAVEREYFLVRELRGRLQGQRSEQRENTQGNQFPG